jgi:hypothetical protein
MVIKRIGVASAAKISGALNAGIGLIFGLLFAGISSVGAGLISAMQPQGSNTWMAPMFGVGAIVVLPIVYGCVGLVFGAIWAGLYNLFSAMVGGLELEVKTA